MKLYFDPQSRATITKWLLDEYGADYEIVPISLAAAEHKAPAFLAINPAGKLPALTDGDTKLFENTAIALYLGDKYPDAGLSFAFGTPERGRYLSLMVYSTSQVEPAMGDFLMQLETGRSRGWNDWETTKKVVESELGDGPYLFGERFTACDVLIGSMFIWKRRFGGPADSPALEAYVDRLLARPHAAAVRG
jgi:glutathione S-transferase